MLATDKFNQVILVKMDVLVKGVRLFVRLTPPYISAAEMASPAYSIEDSVTYQIVVMDDTVRVPGSASACFHKASISQFDISKPAGYKDHASQGIILLESFFSQKTYVEGPLVCV